MKVFEVVLFVFTLFPIQVTFSAFSQGGEIDYLGAFRKLKWDCLWNNLKFSQSSHCNILFEFMKKEILMPFKQHLMRLLMIQMGEPQVLCYQLAKEKEMFHHFTKLLLLLLPAESERVK